MCWVEAWPGLQEERKGPGVRVLGSRLTTPPWQQAVLILGKNILPGDGPPVPSRLLHGDKVPGSHGTKISSSSVRTSRAQVRSGQAVCSPAALAGGLSKHFSRVCSYCRQNRRRMAVDLDGLGDSFPVRAKLATEIKSRVKGP